MRLYLSSYQLGDHPEVFTGMVRGPRRGWVIMNAFDGAHPEVRRLETERQMVNLEGIGLAARELDLREHDAGSLSVKFGRPDFLWVRGGNVFMLRAALARSGADALIADRLRADELVYAGFSAGYASSPRACGASKSVTQRRMPCPCMGSEALTRVAAAYLQERRPFWALRDGQALVVNGNSVVHH